MQGPGSVSSASELAIADSYSLSPNIDASRFPDHYSQPVVSHAIYVVKIVICEVCNEQKTAILSYFEGPSFR